MSRVLPGSLLCGLWLGLFWPVLRWLVTVPFAHANYRLNLFLLLAIGVICIGRLRRNGTTGILAAPRSSAAAATLMLGAAAVYVAADFSLRLHTLSAILFGMGTYGLFGLFVPAARFRQALGTALLLIGVLPFGAHGSSSIGLAVRVLVAQGVRFLLSGLHIGALSVESILVLENGIAHIDVPCSGLRSLWAAGLFYLLATWMLRRRICLRWLVGGALLFILMILANIFRVLLLVLIGLHLELPKVAEVLHLPLGLIGFTAACAISLFFLYGVPAFPAEATKEAGAEAGADAADRPAPAAFLPGLAAALIGLILIHVQRPMELRQPAHAEPSFPAEMVARPVPLDDGERSLFGRFDARASKWRFSYRGLSGSLLAVAAASVRAHHPPEVCLVAHGLRILSIRTIAPQPGMPMRLLDLEALSGGPHRDPDAPRLTAVHWFQSRSRTVDSFLLRVYAALFAKEQQWIMVSVLLDSAPPLSDERLFSLLVGAHTALGRALLGASP